MLIAEGWESYQRRVMPLDASPSQIKETRRAIYAGVQIMMAIMHGLGDDAISGDEGVAIMESVADELRTFNAMVGAGIL